MPVATDDKSDNADTDNGTVVDQGNMGPLVGILDITRIHPAPVRARNDITPAIVLQTALNCHRDPSPQDRHHRIVSGGSSAEVDGLGGVRQLGICRKRKDEHCRSKNQYFQIVHIALDQTK
jgi:hypothetical protein